MNRKLISVVFCALVCSTLGHEYLRANELSRQHERIARRAPYVGIHENRNSNKQCYFYCPCDTNSTTPEGGSYLNLIRGANIFGLVNSSAEVAIGFHLEESLVIVINGKTGATVLLDIVKEVGIYFPAGSNDNLWLSAKVSFEEYILKLNILTSVRNWANGQNFNLKSAPKQVITVVVSIIIHLSYEISKRVEKNSDSVISILVVLTKTLVKSVDILKLVLSKLGNSVNIVIEGGLVKLVGIIQGLQVLSDRIPGILKYLTVNLNSALLLSYSSGFGTILNILSQNSKSVDFSKVLGKQLEKPEDLLALAVVLDYGSYKGIAGITAVIYNVYLYAAKKISLENLIDILIQVEASNVEKIDKKTWDEHISLYASIIQNQKEKFNNGEYWSVHLKFVEDVKNDKLVVSGINVSAIINLLIKSSGSSSLNRVVRVLLELKVLVSVTTIVATLYLRLVWFVISGQGIIFITQLLPNISININFSSLTSIIVQILSSINIASILRYIITLDVVGILTHLPVLGPIFQALDSALKAVGSAAQVSLTQALKDTTSVVTSLKNWIWFGLGRGGSKPSGGGIAGLSAIGGGVSVSYTSTWTITSSWTSSSSGGTGSSGSGSSGGGSSESTARPTTGSGGGGSSGNGGGGSTGNGGGGSTGNGGGGSSVTGGSSGNGSGGSSGTGGSSGSWSWGWGGSAGSGGSGSGSGGSGSGGSGGGGGGGGGGGVSGSSSGGGSSGSSGGWSWGWGK